MTIRYGPHVQCVIEVFTFLRMGGDLTRICVRPILGAASWGDALPVSCALPPTTTTAQERTPNESIHAAFVSFRVQEASCFGPDKDVLLAAIETGFASLDEFNALCAAALVRALEHSAVPLEAHAHLRGDTDEGTLTKATDYRRRSWMTIGWIGKTVLALAPLSLSAGTSSATKPNGSMPGFGPPVQV